MTAVGVDAIHAGGEQHRADSTDESVEAEGEQGRRVCDAP